MTDPSAPAAGRTCWSDRHPVTVLTVLVLAPWLAVALIALAARWLLT